MKNFDDIIREKLGQYEARPDAALWNAIEQRLSVPGAPTNFQTPFLAGIAASAAIAIGLSVLPPIGSEKLTTELEEEVVATHDTTYVETNNPSLFQPAAHTPQVVHEIALHDGDDRKGIPNGGTMAEREPDEADEIDPIDPDTEPDSETQLQEVQNPEKLEISFSATGIQCPGSEVSFKASGIHRTDEINWIFDGIHLKTGMSVSHTFEEIGVHEATMVVRSVNGGSQSTSRFIEIFEKPTPEFFTGGSTNLSCFKQELRLSATPAAYSYTWVLNGDTIGEGTHAQSEVSPGRHHIALVAVNEAGCTSIETKEVSVENGLQLFAPNSFTPNNGDDKNALWIPQGLDEARNFSISILRVQDNTVVYESSELSGWNGSIKGTAERARQGEHFMARVVVTDGCNETKEFLYPILVM